MFPYTFYCKLKEEKTKGKNWGLIIWNEKSLLKNS